MLGACGNAGEWKAALQLLEDMRQAGVTPNKYNYSAASEKVEEITGRSVGRHRGRQPDKCGRSIEANLDITRELARENQREK